jgi:UDP-galactopyranose mutase
MFDRMLAHRNIRIMLQTDFRAVEHEISAKRVIFTGPMDEYFHHIHGPLPYRSLRLDFETQASEHYQETGTINFPNENAMTRITEMKYLTGQKHERTTIVREYPCAYVPGETVPYYPVPRVENAWIYSRYLEEAKKVRNKVVFAGRLADYKYYNMDQAVAHALKVFEQQVAGAERELAVA